MPGLTKCQLLIIVLGVRRKWISTALLEVAQATVVLKAQRMRLGLKMVPIFSAGRRREQQRWLAVPLMAGSGELRDGHGRGTLYLLAGCSGGAGRERVSKTVWRRGISWASQEPGEVSNKSRAEAAVPPTAPGQRGRQRAATSRETPGLCLRVGCSIPRTTSCPRLWSIWIPPNKFSKLLFGSYLWRKLMVQMVKYTNFKPAIPKYSVTFTLALLLV